ncbi:MAG: aldolase/citrate lyase family protein [Chloroflexota bacterium]|nr:aldolase/citrate lyase family protein [Chloroflexota bacterium]
MIDQSDTYDADVVVFDLEDLVHDGRKHAARSRIQHGVEQARRGGSEVFVRCDLELLYADLQAAVWRGLQGIILPKVDSVDQVHQAEDLLAHFEAARGVMQAGLVHEVNEFDEPRSVENSLEIHLCLENARGNEAAMELMKSSRRVRSASLGRADLVMDLRGEPNGELHLMPFLMQRLIVVANASGVSPIGAWWQASSRGLRANAEDTLRAARLGRLAGFKGALCVMPEQVAALNRGFTPSHHEVREATSHGLRDVVDWAEACRARDAAKRQAAEWASA